MTFQTFINLALRDLEVIYPGQTPSTDQSNEALSTLNEILGNWSHEGLLVPTHAVTQFSLMASTSAYTMGVGANWVTSALPIKVKGAVSSLGTFQQGLQVLSMEAFEASIANGLGKTAVLPARIGVDNSAPLRNVRVWPTPNNSAAVIEVSYWMPMAAVALGDTVAFALPAFEEAVRNELALRLASMSHVPITQGMATLAQSSRAALARIDPSEVTEQVAPQAQARPAA